MTGSPIDIIIFAPLAPLFGVILFWFIQLLFIESQKYLLSKIRPKHEPYLQISLAYCSRQYVMHWDTQSQRAVYLVFTLA